MSEINTVRNTLTYLVKLTYCFVTDRITIERYFEKRKQKPRKKRGKQITRAKLTDYDTLD